MTAKWSQRGQAEKPGEIPASKLRAGEGRKGKYKSYLVQAHGG